MSSISHVAEHAGKRHYQSMTVPSGEKLTRQYLVLPDRTISLPLLLRLFLMPL